MTHANLKSGQSVRRVIGAALINISYQKIAAASGAVGQLAIPDTAAHEAIVQADGGDIRWRADGFAPTTDTGHSLRDGESITIAGYAAMAAFRFIGKTGAVAVSASYWG